MSNKKNIPVITFLCLGLAVFTAFYFSSKSTETKTNTIQAKSKEIENQTVDLSAAQKEVAQIATNYVSLSKQGKFPDVEKLLVKVDSSNYFSFEKMEPSPEKEKKEKKSSGETPDASPIIDSIYEFVKDINPKRIYEGQWDIYKISNARIIKDKAKIFIEMKRDVDTARSIKQNFYLIKNSRGEWKIFQISYSNSVEEMDNPGLKEV